MKIYINNYDNDEITTMEVNDKYTYIVDNADEEGEREYEKIATQLRKLIAKVVNNPAEVYSTKEEAERCFAPILCF